MNDMTVVTAPAVERDRTKFIGGSDAAAILGLSKWKTPLSLYLEKTGQHVEQITAEKQKIFDRGHRWEPIAREMLFDHLEANGHEVKLLEVNKVYTDETHPFLQCEIDAEILLDGEHVNVEIKTVHPFAANDWGAMGTDEVPIYYATQAMHGLGLTNRRLTVVGCLIGADSMTPYFVERDEETIEAMREKCIEFWQNHVQAGVAPDPNTMADMRFLLARFNGRPVEVSDEIAARLYELQAIRDRMNSWERSKEDIEFEIADAIRIAWNLQGAPDDVVDNAEIRHNGTVIGTWKKQSRDTIESKPLRRAHPDIAEAFTKTSWFRVLRLKGESR